MISAFGGAPLCLMPCLYDANALAIFPLQLPRHLPDAEKLARAVLAAKRTCQTYICETGLRAAVAVGSFKLPLYMVEDLCRKSSAPHTHRELHSPQDGPSMSSSMVFANLTSSS